MNNIVFKLKKIFLLNKRVILTLLAISLIIPSFTSGADDTSPATLTMQRPKAENVPNRTLIIGTHMIEIEGLTKELNEIAQNTVKNKNQHNEYYKSELTDFDRQTSDHEGGWYQIDNANDIKDISLASKHMITNEFIDSLDIEYYTNSNGITYNLKTGEEVDAYNIEDVYSLASMEELQNLQKELEARDAKESKDDNDNKLIDSLKRVLELDVKNDLTKNYDSQLDNLKKYYDYVVDRGGSPKEKTKLFDIRSSVNAYRKEEVINQVIAKIEDETGEVEELKSSYQESSTALQTSKSKIEKDKLALGSSATSTFFQTKERQLTESLINNAKSRDTFDKADLDLRDLLALDDIINLKVSDKERQTVVNDELDANITNKYNALLKSGETEEYQQAKSSKGSNRIAVLSDLKIEYKSQLERIGIDKNHITKMKIQLAGSLSDKQTIINDNINEVDQLINELTDRLNQKKASSSNLLNSDNSDAYLVIAINYLKSRKSFLQGLLKTVDSKLNKNFDQLKQLDKLKSLKTEQKKALDRNNLTRAKDITNQIDKIYKSADNKNKNINRKIDNLTKTNANIQNRLNSDSLNSNEKQTLKNQLANNQSKINKLKDSLYDLSSAGSSATPSMLAGKTNSYGAGTENGTGTGNGSGTGATDLGNLDSVGLNDADTSDEFTGKSQRAISSKIVNDAKQRALDSLSKIDMKDADVQDLSGNIGEIKDVLDSDIEVAYPALVDIKDNVDSKVSDSDTKIPSSLLDVADNLSDVVDEYKETYDLASASDLDENRLNDQIESFMANNNLKSDEDKLLVIGALNELLGNYGEAGDNISSDDLNDEQKVVKSVLDNYLKDFKNSQSNKNPDDDETLDNENNSILAMQLIDKKYYNGELYCPAEIVAKIIDAKYIWNENLVKGWLINKTKTYLFMQGRNNAIINKNYKMMSNIAAFEPNTVEMEAPLWLPKSFIKSEFHLNIQGLNMMNKSIIYDDRSYSLMQQLLNILKP